MNERIKKLRKALDLTQQAFADRLGIKQNTIAKYETNRGSPTTSVIALICREFNVSEAWLRTGMGEMFEPKEEDALEELVKQRGLTQSDRILIEKFMDLKPGSRQAVMEYMKKVVAALNEEATLPGYEPTPVADTSGQERTELDADGLRPVSAEFEAEARAKAELYYQQLLSEQEQARQARFANGSDAG